MTIQFRASKPRVHATNLFMLSLILSTKFTTPSLAHPISTAISNPASSPWSSLPASAPNFDASNSNSNHKSFGEGPGHPPSVPTTTAYEEPDLDHGEEDSETWVLEPPPNLLPSSPQASTEQTASPKTPSSPPSSVSSITSSLTSLFSLTFWRALLGSYFIFWALIASTVGGLVLVAVRVKQLEKSRSWQGIKEEEGTLKHEDHGDASDDESDEDQQDGRMTGLERLRAAVMAGARDQEWKTEMDVESIENDDD